MSIDTSMYRATLPAGTYNAGDVIPMTLIKGPAVVRDGYGKAEMKRVVSFSNTVPGGFVAKVSVQNSSWIDALKNFITSAAGIYTTFATTGCNVQKCGDVELQPNSAWSVNVEINETVTTTVPVDVFCLIDIDYPSVAAVANPQNEKGNPVTLELSATVTTVGPGTALDWFRQSVDIFKAGYKYLIAETAIGAGTGGSNQFGFVAISGAAGQAGLCQIIPCLVRPMGGMRLDYDYSNVFVKGPMLIEMAVLDINGTPGTENIHLEMDCIRR